MLLYNMPMFCEGNRKTNVHKRFLLLGTQHIQLLTDKTINFVYLDLFSV